MRPRIEEYHSQVARLFPDPNERTVRNVTVQLTDACNLRCTYCYQIAKKNHFIPAELAIKYIKHILTGDNPYINFENSNGMVLEFIGGEPLLAIDTMSEIVEWVFDYMIKNNHPWLHRTRLSVCSNGTLYFEPKVQKFLERWHNVTSFSISIDGNKRLHDSCRLFPDGRGSYDIAAAAAKDFINRYPYHFTGTKLTLSPDNVSYAFEALKNLYEEFGYTCIHANCCYEEGWELKHATILYHELVKLTDWLEENNLLDSIYYSLFEDSHFKPMEPGDDDNWCGGNGSMIACDWKGDIYPCIRYMESSLGNDAPPVIIGTVDGGIEATCEQKHCVECLKAVDRRTQSTDECYNCPIAGGCSWCSGYNYQLFGTANKRATFICVMHKARALANSYFWAKYRKHHPKEPCVYEHHVPNEWALEIIGEDELNKLKAVMAE